MGVAPSSSSCRDASNDVLFDLERSIWNLTSGQAEIWPQVKVTWWPRGHGNCHVAYHSMRTDKTNPSVPFILQSLYSITSCNQYIFFIYRKLVTSLWRKVPLKWRLPCLRHHLPFKSGRHFGFNPRPTRVFFITRTTRGGWCDPPLAFGP